MITIYAAMLVILGFLLAALLLIVLLPAYRRRIERFTSERLKRALPLTEAEIRADKDRIRAEYAIEVHNLEMQLEEAALAAARQSVEINRREAKVHELEEAIDAQKTNVNAHENARRVLEQAIMDRLPKVEQRLTEARRLLVQRDREIAALTETSNTQTEALKEATQINVQQADELHRVKAALETRAARNRETLGDPRFDGEVALRTEIEALRSKTREQAAMIERLHGGVGSEAEYRPPAGEEEMVERLKGQLAKAEAELNAIRAGESSDTVGRADDGDKVRDLQSQLGAQNAEIVKLKAAITAYEEAPGGTQIGRDSGIAAKAEISRLQAEVEDQRRTIQALKAEIAGNNERLARQSQHFRDEMRRLGSGVVTAPGTGEKGRSPAEAARRSLAERITQPRVPRLEAGNGQGGGAVESPRDGRQVGFLKALSGGIVADDEAAKSAASGSSPEATPVASGKKDKDGESASGASRRRPRLLERISNIDKS